MFDTSSDKRCIRLSLMRNRAPLRGIKSSLQGDARFNSDTECCSPFFSLFLSQPVGVDEPVFGMKVVEVVDEADESFR